MSVRSRGFTLVELLVVVSIMAIMAGVAAPALQSFLAAQRVKSAASEFALAAVFARSEAIKRNAEVSVVSAAGGWTDGWTVQLGADNLSTQQPYKRLVMSTTPSDLTSIVYLGSGRLKGSVRPSLNIMDDMGGSDSDSRSRCVGFELSGLPRTSKGAC